MTQTSDYTRLRVVDGEAVTGPDALAAQIYTTYVAPESDATLRDPNLPEILLPATPEPTDATAAIAPTEDRSVAPCDDSETPQRRLHLPTLPSPAPSPSAATNGNGQRHPVPSPAPLTDEEATLFTETLRGKLNATDIQALLALLQKESTSAPSEISSRSQAAPLPLRTVNRYRLGAGVLLLILLGIISSALLNRPSGKGLVLPNAPTEATPTTSPTATPSADIPQLDATLASRNVSLDAALKESEGQRDALDQTRRDYLLSLADAEVKKNGTPVEVWLIRRLNAQMLELRRALGKGGQFSGDAKQISTARSLVGDSRAVLLALKEEWQNSNAAPGRSRVAPAVLTKQMSELAELARVIREASYEQQLRDQERSRQQEAGQGAKSPTKTENREVKPNGVLPSP